MSNKRYFFDMDGTLAQYPDLTERWWECPGIFKFLAPQDKVIKAVKRLIESGQEVYILSAYNEAFPDTVRDKNFWMDKYLPEIDMDHRIYTLVGKSKTDYIPGGVKSTDVLLDDYNKNLQAWTTAGGIGIKLLIGLNSKSSWNGRFVKSYGTIKEIEETLLDIDMEL